MPTIHTNDVDTYYQRRGEGPPIVFVHGAIVDSRHWEPQLEAISDEYTTIAYDVRGHGRTGPSPRPHYSIELFADDLAALIDGLGLEKPVLCGLSTGGCIAQVYAARNPEQLSGLVLADTFTPEILSRAEWLQRSLLMRAAIPPVRFFGYERVEAAMVWLQKRVKGEAVSGGYEAIQTMWEEEGPGMYTAEFAKVIRAVVDYRESEVDLSSITVPTLVVYGENDAGFVGQHAANLGVEVPEVTLQSVPDAGHLSNLENRAVFTEALRRYLADLEGTAAPTPESEDSTAVGH